MSKEQWVAAYERVYDEFADTLSEEEMEKLASEKAAEREAALVDLAVDLYYQEEY